MVIEKVWLYRAMDNGNEFSVAFELARRENLVFTIPLRHHAKVYPLANSEVRDLIGKKTNLQLQVLMRKLNEHCGSLSQAWRCWNCLGGGCGGDPP
ncbi:hypothetical protein L195_g042374 [Trifolium pratense]|uniref:Uncharacterized protein n=1 Tax=Trifolium pratense TaxID=57577 RepID=A0A2K3M672_TRIPR|nr:hypothetical protein L195_g042374 [Trifolium pratense]